MRVVKYILSAFFILIIAGCSNESSTNPVDIIWDRDMCTRCSMVVSERNFAVEVIDPKTNKAYKFDDIGCAIDWFSEKEITWENSAIIWVKDYKSSKWLDAKDSKYIAGVVSPMTYGFGAFHKDAILVGKNYTYSELKELINKNKGYTPDKIQTNLEKAIQHSKGHN